MSELKNRRGNVIAVLDPQEAPYTFTQRVYRYIGADGKEREYVLSFNQLTTINGEETGKIKGVQLSAK